MKEKKEKKGNFWKPGEKPPQSANKSPLNKSHKNSNNRRQSEEKQDMSVISRHPAKSPASESTNRTKPTLSSSVMTMKFMSKKASEALPQDDKKRPLAATVQTTNTSSTTEVTVSDENIASLPGRRSFRGFNPIVERHYNTVMNNQRYDSKLATISDEDMVQRYDELVGLPRGPNQGKASKKAKRA